MSDKSSMVIVLMLTIMTIGHIFASVTAQNRHKEVIATLETIAKRLP